MHAEFNETWLLGSKEKSYMGFWYEDQSAHIEAHCSLLFTRFLRVLLCDLIPKPFVYQHIQVLCYICFISIKWDFISVLQKEWSWRFPSLLLSSPLWNMLSPAGIFSPPVEKLHSLSDEEWTVFLLQLHSSLEEQNPSAPLSSSSIAPPPPSTVTRSRLNLLCYLCCVVGHKVIANRLINSTLVGKHVLT